MVKLADEVHFHSNKIRDFTSHDGSVAQVVQAMRARSQSAWRMWSVQVKVFQLAISMRRRASITLAEVSHKMSWPVSHYFTPPTCFTTPLNLVKRCLPLAPCASTEEEWTWS